MPNVLLELLRAGLTPEQITALGAEVARRRQALIAQGFPPLAVEALSGPALFGVAGSALPVVAGTNEIDRELQARIAAESALLNRGTTALDLLTLLYQRAAERAEAERSPFRFIDYLRNVSTLPPGEAGNPIQALIGRDVFIEPKVPVETPEERTLLERLMSFANPASPFQTERVENPDLVRVREAYARDPVAAQRFFEEASRNPEGVRRMFGPRQFARGGTMVTDEPVVAIGARSRRPRFIAGEAGPELVRIRPLRRFAHGGDVLANAPFGTAGDASGRRIAPREAAAVALGQALRSNPFAPRELVDALLSGRPPAPGFVTQRFVANADPVLLKGLQAVVEAFGVLPEQFEAAQRQYRIPGFGVVSVSR